MNYKNRIIFLGYSKKKTKIIDFLKKKNFEVIEFRQKKINYQKIHRNDLLVSFGYKRIIGEKILKKLNFSPVNLHMSYLPYNRGSHPNFWSFIENTPKGVTIHKINDKIDAGDIICQKKIIIELNRKTTFYSTYKILFNEIEKLFVKNFKIILEKMYKSNVLKNYKPKVNKNKGSFHFKKELPKNFNWKQPIISYLKTLN